MMVMAGLTIATVIALLMAWLPTRMTIMMVLPILTMLTR